MGNRLIIGVLVIIFGCGTNQEKVRDSSKLNIVATTGMIGDAIANIVQDSAVVTSLMGPGVDPHLYKATQGDLQKLTSADVIFYNGLYLEGKMGEVLEKLGRVKPVIAIAEKVDANRLRKADEYNDSYDPHIWFDVSLWQEAVQVASGELQKRDPDNAAFYAQNTQGFQAQLDSLHQWVKKEINVIPKSQRVLITAHDAFGYFGHAYDIEVKGLQGISTLSEYGLRDVANLVNYITDRKIKSVFLETSVSKKAINAVVQGCIDKGFEVSIGGNLYSDAMGPQNTPEGAYIGMVESNVRTIVDALK